MQMRAGRATSGTDIPDHIPLLDARSLFQALGKAVHMGIGGVIGIIVADQDVVAITTIAADLGNRAITSGKDRGAGRGSKVDAFVHLGVAKDRVLALAIP